jgi:two-component system, OmpR family, phosphate regulon sensor histidine kinase PhoR
MNKLLHSRKVRAAIAIVLGIAVYFFIMFVERIFSLEASFGLDHLALAGILSTALVFLFEEIFHYYSNQQAKILTTIVDALQRISAGDLSVQLPKTGSPELKQISELTNQIVGNLKRDIAKFEKLERVRSEFLANVSHELRTPIFSIQGFIETLIDGAMDDPKVNREFLQKAYEHSERLNTLLNDLIEISRIESGEMRMSFRYFDITKFLGNVIEEVLPKVEKKSLEIVQCTNSDEVLVLGDKERIRQVLYNLIDNSIKYTDDGGKIEVGFDELPNSVRLFVRDNGAGIAEEHLSRIFERFYRVDKDRSRSVGGTGLGLAIVKHIIEAHNSKVEVRSEPGKGSEFSFTLKK